jgi:hypothetical protein
MSIRRSPGIATRRDETQGCAASSPTRLRCATTGLPAKCRSSQEHRHDDVPMVARMLFRGMPRGETAEIAAPMLLRLKLLHGQRDPTG